jgi:eukaryotic-like serine/threonine-protein kinase
LIRGKGNFYCFDAVSGEKLWSINDIGITEVGSPIVYKGIVYFNSDLRIMGVNCQTGDVIVKQGLRSCLHPSVFEDDLFVNSSASLGSITYGMNLDLQPPAIWRYNWTGTIFTAPCISKSGLIYSGSIDGHLAAINQSSGKEEWYVLIGEGIDSEPSAHNHAIYSSPSVADGKVFFGCKDSCFYAVEAKTGTQLWNFKTKAPIISSPAYAEGLIFFGGLDSCLYALDAGSGHEEWRFKSNGPIGSSPVINNGIVYFTCADGYLYALY